MLFAVTGMLKPDAEAKLPGLQEAFNEHLAQPFRRIRLAGPLRGADGHRLGFMALIEAENFGQAEAYLHQSPLFRAELYERVDVAEYEVEVGRLD
jgi:uncharacterized protein YciI